MFHCRFFLMRRTKLINPRLVPQIVDCGALIRGLLFLESWTDPSARRFRDRQRTQGASTGWWGATHMRLHLQCCNRSVGLRINDPVYELRDTSHGTSSCSGQVHVPTRSRRPLSLAFMENRHPCFLDSVLRSWTGAKFPGLSWRNRFRPRCKSGGDSKRFSKAEPRESGI
jgi:hypothetical protein